VCVCVFYGMSILAVSIIVYVCVRVCWSVMCHFVRRLSFVREEKTTFWAVLPAILILGRRRVFLKTFSAHLICEKVPREKPKNHTQALLGDVNKISTVKIIKYQLLWILMPLVSKLKIKSVIYHAVHTITR